MQDPGHPISNTPLREVDEQAALQDLLAGLLDRAVKTQADNPFEDGHLGAEALNPEILPPEIAPGQEPSIQHMGEFLAGLRAVLEQSPHPPGAIEDFAELTTQLLQYMAEARKVAEPVREEPVPEVEPEKPADFSSATNDLLDHLLEDEATQQLMPEEPPELKDLESLQRDLLEGLLVQSDPERDLAFQDARRELLGSLIDSLESDSAPKAPAAIGAFGSLRNRLLEAFDAPQAENEAAAPPPANETKPISMPPAAEAVPALAQSRTEEPPVAPVPSEAAMLPIPEPRMEAMLLEDEPFAFGEHLDPLLDVGDGNDFLNALLADILSREAAAEEEIAPQPEPPPPAIGGVDVRELGTMTKGLLDGLLARVGPNPSAPVPDAATVPLAAERISLGELALEFVDESSEHFVERAAGPFDLLLDQIDSELGAPPKIAGQDDAAAALLPGARLVAFQLGGRFYGLPLDRVIETDFIPQSTHVPGMPPYLRGVANLRGEILPLVDLRLMFDLSVNGQDGRVLVVRDQAIQQPIGFIVDRLSGIASIPMSDIALPAKDSGNRISWYLGGCSTHGGQPLEIFDPDLVLAAVNGEEPLMSVNNR